jgi:hypothetical protein
VRHHAAVAVNGKFTPVQRELYGFYLSVYESVLYENKPNITAQDVVKAALPKWIRS